MLKTRSADTPFDPKWPHGHTTRDGRKARILATDLKGDYPIVAAIADSDGDEWIVRSDATGRTLYGRANRLINAPAPKRKVRVRGWIKVFSDGSASGVFPADQMAGSLAFACKLVEFEVEEGEGLNDR